MNSDKTKEVRVRFAPSPTGFLHVGGARTAIFNWLFARNQNGKFLLRIEDTDPGRSKSELTQQILRSMHWLGMDADEPVVYQSDNIERYRQVAHDLMSKGKAYYAFETTEELEQKRKEAEIKKTYYKYDRASLDLPGETIEKYLKEKKPYSIRFFVEEGTTEFNDLVHGPTSFNNSEIDDFILIRTDGSPVYQLAVVVDDHDMGITHIIRGDDHLSNTPKQIMLYKAAGWEVPHFAHLPMILDEQKKKLSKRRNTVSAEEYRHQGYLPEALFNFLTLLGFSPLHFGEGAGGEVEKQEICSKEEFIQMFDFKRVNKKSSVFDIKKLNWINFQYIMNSDEKYLCGLLKEYLEQQQISSVPDDYLIKVIKLMKPRVETVNQFFENGRYFFLEPESYDEKGIAKFWNNDIKPAFTEYFSTLKTSVETFIAADVERGLREFAELKGIKPSGLIHILRIALTGGTASVGIFELMEVLGKDAVIRRIKRFLE